MFCMVMIPLLLMTNCSQNVLYDDHFVTDDKLYSQNVLYGDDHFVTDDKLYSQSVRCLQTMILTMISQ